LFDEVVELLEVELMTLELIMLELVVVGLGEESIFCNSGVPKRKKVKWLLFFVSP